MPYGVLARGDLHGTLEGKWEVRGGASRIQAAPCIHIPGNLRTLVQADRALTIELIDLQSHAAYCQHML